MGFYFFNVTNSEDVLNNNAKPIVNQTGILSYREVQEKFNLSYSNGSESVAYLNNHTYIFDEATSSIKETDEIITSNFIMWTVLDSVETDFMRQILVQVINQLYKNDSFEVRNGFSPFYKVQVGDLLWGKNDNQFLKVISELLHVNIPTKFGLQANHSLDGVHEVYTGVGHDNENRGMYKSWNGSDHVPYWNSEYCNRINGTDGTIFPTFMNSPQRLYMFNTDLCRSIYMTEEMMETLQGVKTSKYSAPKEVFNVSFADNKCFCSTGKQCEDGLLDVSNCFATKMNSLFPKMDGFELNVSLIMSSPHFLNAENETIDSVIGLKPNKKQHETYINIEMETGVALKAAKRLQLNTRLYHGQHTDNLDSLSKLPLGWTQLLPVFWAEEKLELSTDITNELKDKFFMPLTVVAYASYALIAFGILFLMAALAIFVCFPVPQILHVDLDNDLDDRNSLIPPSSRESSHANNSSGSGNAE